MNYFSAVNPGMEWGGLFNYSKFDILDKLDPKHRPKTLKIPAHADFSDVKAQLDLSGISFPLIAKPDFGERGRGVRKIYSLEELNEYAPIYSQEAILIQEFIDYPEEYGVFILKNPRSGTFQICSLTAKIPLQVLGDGHSTLSELIRHHPRAKRYSLEISQEKMDSIPLYQERVPLSQQGNHCKGATFLDKREFISDQMISCFEKICRPLDGFYYGRLDVKVASLEGLSHPDSIKVLEINGVNSEPIHIYDSNFSYWEACEEIWNHLDKMGAIARENLKVKSPGAGFSDFILNLNWYFKRNRSDGK